MQTISVAPKMVKWIRKYKSTAIYQQIQYTSFKNKTLFQRMKYMRYMLIDDQICLQQN